MSSVNSFDEPGRRVLHLLRVHRQRLAVRRLGPDPVIRFPSMFASLWREADTAVFVSPGFFGLANAPGPAEAKESAGTGWSATIRE